MLERFTWYRQSAFRFRDDGITVYLDPWGLPGPDPADVVFITHAHYDHFDMDDIAKVTGPRTRFVAPRDVAAALSGDVTPVRPGDALEVAGIKVQVVPAYNIVESRLENHPKANGWVGYVLTMGGATYYDAGDTDHLEELESVRADAAFVPIGGTYTMDPPEAAGFVKVLGPQVAVPMHYGFVVGSPSDGQRFADLAAPVKVEILTPQNPFELE